MITEQLEETASLYALGALEPGERAAFEEELAGNEELRRLVDDLLATAANLAYTAPLRMPPPHLEMAIMREIRDSKIVRPNFSGDALDSRGLWQPLSRSRRLALREAKQIRTASDRAAIRAGTNAPRSCPPLDRTRPRCEQDRRFGKAGRGCECENRRFEPGTRAGGE